MKITAILVHPMGMPAERVRWTAQEITRRVELTLVEVRTDTGIIGIGEISTGPQSVVCKLLDDMAAVIWGWTRSRSTRRGASCSRSRCRGQAGSAAGRLAAAARAQPAAAVHGGHGWHRHRAVGHRGQGGEQAGVPLLGGTRTDVHTYAVGGYYEEGAPLLAYADEWRATLPRAFAP